MSYEGKTFSVVVRPSDWKSSYGKLQSKIEKKTGLTFPSNCYLRIRLQNEDGNVNVNDDNRTTIHSLESLKTGLTELNEKKVYADICVEQIKAEAESTGNHQCMIKYDAIGNNKKQNISFTWIKGDDFDIDEFFDDFSNAIENEIDFGKMDITMDDIDDVLKSFDLYYWSSNNNKTTLIAKKDDLEDLMLDDLNDDDDVENIFFVLKQVKHFLCAF